MEKARDLAEEYNKKLVQSALLVVVANALIQLSADVLFDFPVTVTSDGMAFFDCFTFQPVRNLPVRDGRSDRHNHPAAYRRQILQNNRRPYR